MFSLPLALAVAGIASVLFLHWRQRKDPQAAAAWTAALRYACWAGFLVGAAFYLVFFSHMSTGTGPGNAMAVMGGIFLGPVLGCVAWGISLPIFYGWNLRASRAPAPTSWNPYFPGLVFTALGFVQTLSPAVHSHPRAWATFFFCLGAGACLSAYSRGKEWRVHWAAFTAAGALLGLIGYATVRGLGPIGQFRRKAWEAETRASLAEVRTALDRYAREHGGQYPKSLINDNDMRALISNRLPEARLEPYHRDTRLLHETTNLEQVFGGPYAGYWGGWVYFNDPEKPRFFVACSHTDTNGSVWSSY